MRKNMIRELTYQDIELITKYITDKTFDCCELCDFWSEKELLTWFSDSSNICLGYFEDDTLLGFCLTYNAKEINKVYLENIYVVPQYRRRGIARSMMNRVLQSYTTLYQNQTIRFVALVGSENRSAILTLEKLGFSVGDNMYWVQKNVNC